MTRWTGHLRLVSDTDYHPHTFDEERFAPLFNEGGKWLMDHAQTTQQRYSERIHEWALRKQPLTEDERAYVEVTNELDRFIVRHAGAMALFEGTVRLYADELSVWSKLRHDFRLAAAPAALVLIALIVGAAAMTTSPSFGENHRLNLLVATALLVLSGLALSWICRRLRQIAGVF